MDVRNNSSEFLSDERFEKILGTIERVIYCNEENGYMVCDLGTDDDDIITVTGIMPYITEGDRLILYGEWKNNAKYGRQFAVSQYEKCIPADAASILRYLSSGAVKGIGKKTAQKIVDEFGDNSLEVIENHPDWLSDIPGMSLNKAKKISEEFKQNIGIRNAMLFFGEFFGMSLTVKIYKRWGSAAVDIAKENPYRLCDEIDGIGFEKADRMAQKLELGFDLMSRCESGTMYVLSGLSLRDGHVCLPKKLLVNQASTMLSVEQDVIETALDRLAARGKIKIVCFDGETFVYDKYSYENERFIACKLNLINNICPAVGYADVNLFIEKEERKNGFTYASMQKRALIDALENGVLLLTGGPGTGKTTVVRALLGIFKSMDMRVSLTAPTGRAAKKLSESTSYEAKTIHRLLEYEYSGETDVHAGFRKNETDLLEDDVVIVDEASMIDNSLMASLLRAVKPGARMIIIGDSDQLPSVGAGNVLHDLIDSRKFATVRLNEIFRQAGQSVIVTNAHKINNGEMPILDIKDNDFFFLARNTDREISLTVVDLCKNRLPKTYKEMAVNGTQVISPSRKGEAGTENLNLMLREALNPLEKITANQGFGTRKERMKREYHFRDTIFREGDRVMQIKNNYEAEWFRDDDSTGSGIFNGDIGVIEEIDNDSGNISVLFEDRHVVYDVSMLDELDHAYAITVHKSQGSEYPIVIIPLYNAPPVLLTRNLFYTAVTRAQKMVILVGRVEVARKMVDNNRLSFRHTGLKRQISEI